MSAFVQAPKPKHGPTSASKSKNKGFRQKREQTLISSFEDDCLFGSFKKLTDDSNITVYDIKNEKDIHCGVPKKIKAKFMTLNCPVVFSYIGSNRGELIAFYPSDSIEELSSHFKVNLQMANKACNVATNISSTVNANVVNATLSLNLGKALEDKTNLKLKPTVSAENAKLAKKGIVVDSYGYDDYDYKYDSPAEEEELEEVIVVPNSNLNPVEPSSDFNVISESDELNVAIDLEPIQVVKDESSKKKKKSKAKTNDNYEVPTDLLPTPESNQDGEQTKSKKQKAKELQDKLKEAKLLAKSQQDEPDEKEDVKASEPITIADKSKLKSESCAKKKKVQEDRKKKSKAQGDY